MRFLSLFLAVLLVTNGHGEEVKAVKKEEKKEEKKIEKKNEKDKVVVIAAVETGSGQAFSGDSAKTPGQKQLIHAEAGAGISGGGMDGKAVLFVTKDDVIRPGYFTAGYRMTVGNKDYFVGPFKFKGDVGWIAQGDKDPNGDIRILGGMYLRGLAGICTSHKEEAKIRLCIETFVKGITYIDTGARLEAGYGLQLEAKSGENKLYMGARHTVMMTSADLHSAGDTTGQYFTINVGLDFDVTGKASKGNKK